MEENPSFTHEKDEYPEKHYQHCIPRKIFRGGDNNYCAKKMANIIPKALIKNIGE